MRLKESRPGPRWLRVLVAVVVVNASLALLGGAGLAADCRSNTECIPPVTTASPAGLAGENGWWRSDLVVALVCTDAGSGCSSTSYSIDGTSFSTYTGPFPVTGEGLHFLEAASVDAAGNKESPELIVLRIDATPPSAAFARPTAGNVYVANVQDPADPALPVTVAIDETSVEASIRDALSGAGRFELYVDGALRGGNAAAVAFSWQAGDESAGSHHLELRGFDTAGNRASDFLDIITLPTSQAGAQATADAVQAAVMGVVP